MQYETITSPCTLQRWQSEPTDLAALEPRLAARMFFDIALIHAFEHAILQLKNDDCVWGPVHSSVGQEAIAAGATAALRVGDKYLATHRAHHHFLAKVLQAATDAWDPLETALPEAGQRVVARTLAEIMGLADGYCGGRGGSMHLRCAEAGFLGSNAIVGGGIPIATGAAFAEQRRQSGNIVVCFLGDGATNQGAFHEACNLAAIWRLPLLLVIENNQYAVATGIDNACALQHLAERASAYGMAGHIVDGHDPLAVHHVVRLAAERIRQGEGPCLIEAHCYRRYHHAGDKPGSAFNYRRVEDERRHRELEPIDRFPQQLLDAGIFTAEMVARLRANAEAGVHAAVEQYTHPGSLRTVKAECYPAPSTVAAGMRSDGREWEAVRFSAREDFTAFTTMRYADAIAAVTGYWLGHDAEAFVLGEEVANFVGGAYGATRRLPRLYPDRVLNTPISEAGFIGLALGAAMMGMHPVAEIMFADFALVAADQLFNQIGKARHMYGNTTELPLVVRTRVSMGLGYGGQHSMDPVGLYALFPGWRIIAPADVFEYIGQFNSAMVSRDPVLIMEHQALYEQQMPAPEGRLDYYLPLDRAHLVAPGTDVTLVSYSAMTGRCAALLPRFSEAGISVELLNLRSLDFAHIDYDTLEASARKTRAVVIVEEAARSQSIGATLAATLMDRCFGALALPVRCLSSLDVPPPVSRVLERTALLDDEDIFAVVAAAARRETVHAQTG